MILLSTDPSTQSFQWAYKLHQVDEGSLQPANHPQDVSELFYYMLGVMFQLSLKAVVMFPHAGEYFIISGTDSLVLLNTHIHMKIQEIW